MSQTQNTLPTFEDHPVSISAVRLTRCGDGLSEALKLEPKALELGERVSFMVSGIVGQINHKDKDGVITRLHTVETDRIAEVDAEKADKFLAEAADKLARKRAEANGQLALDAEAAAEERESQD